jgi:flagellar hook assembly protein FlgD
MRRAAAISLLLLAATVGAYGQSSPVLRVNSAGTTAFLYWTPVSGAAQYLVRRADAYPNWNHTLTVSSAQTTETVSANAAYVYQIIPQNAQGQTISPASNLALVTTYAFTDATLTAGTTGIKIPHITELRTAVNAARTACALAPATWTNPTLTTDSKINQNDVAELRTALNAALSNIGLASQAFADPALSATTPIRAVHVDELRTRVRAFPEYAVTSSFGVSQRYFSPNGDGQKDTTTINGSFSWGALARWMVNIRNSGGAVVRSYAGSGTTISVVWDGRDAGNAVVPDGDYTAEAVDMESISAPMAATLVTVDTAAPQASITSPAAGAIVSNVQVSGGGDFNVSGSTTDTHFGTWILERTGNNQPTSTIATGSAAVSPAALLGVWHTMPGGNAIPNGTYTLRLTSTDQAGNAGVASQQVTVGHFSASQSAYEINLGSNGTITYTSAVPYAMAETITIKSATTGAVVRTLVNAVQRSAGTYNDMWDGRNDSGQIVRDDVYRYLVTLDDGTYAYTWDDSTRSKGTTKTQYSYPKCRVGAAYVACNDPSVVFDPYAGKPLYINYCVYDGGSGTTYPTCSVASPMLVEAKWSTLGEDPGTCDSTCFFSGYQSSGPHEIIWYGRSLAGTFVSGNFSLLILRRDNTFARNLAVGYGTAPAITDAALSPLAFDPWFQSQTITVSLTINSGRPVALTAQFRNVASGSVLRTITTSTSTASSQSVVWNGRADNGDYVAPGIYEVTITGTDSIGNAVSIKPLSTVRY